MYSHDDETEQETLTAKEVRELYGAHPFVLLVLKGGPKHKNKRLRKRYELTVIQKPPKKPQKKKVSHAQKLVQKRRKQKLENYKKVSYLLKKKKESKKSE